MTKKYVVMLCMGATLSLYAPGLRIRHGGYARQDFQNHCRNGYCPDLRGRQVIYSAAQAENAVNYLRDEAVDMYDSGIYQSEWAPLRQEGLRIQSRLGYTVPDDD